MIYFKTNEKDWYTLGKEINSEPFKCEKQMTNKEIEEMYSNLKIKRGSNTIKDCVIKCDKKTIKKLDSVLEDNGVDLSNIERYNITISYFKDITFDDKLKGKKRNLVENLKYECVINYWINNDFKQKSFKI